MTITVKCPRCGNLCCFAERYSGKRARCIRCNAHFTIPQTDGGDAVIKKKEKTPLPGFYQNALVESWKLFIDPANAKMLIFVVAMVALEYFIGYLDFSITLPGFRVQAPVGIISVFIARGCLFWFYFEIVGSTAFGEERLPDSEIGQGFEFLWNVIKSTYLFVSAFLIVQVPYVLITAILEMADVPLPTFVTTPLVLPGAFIFPMALLTFCSGREIWMAGHIGYLVGPVIKAFRPYLVVAGLTGVAIIVQWYVTYLTIGGYPELQKYGQISAIGGLFLCIASRMISIIAMRAIGLFGYHYKCYMPQLQLDDTSFVNS